MEKPSGSIPPATALDLAALVATTPHGIASRVLSRAAGGTVTLFAFDAGQELSEHTAPFDALVVVLEGVLTLTIDQQPIRAAQGSVTLMPANRPHAVEAIEPARMLLVMLKTRVE